MPAYFKDVFCLALWAGFCGASLLPLAAQTQTPDPSDTTYVRLAIYEGTGSSATFLGNIDVQMLTAEAPLNAANFMGYVEAGTYNTSFIHRAVPGFVIQGGAYKFVSGTLTPVASNPPTVKGEHGSSNPKAFSNVRGTLALALDEVDTSKGGDSQDTGSTSWFFNLVDNTTLDTAEGVTDPSNGAPATSGPFTVFGVVANSSSLAVMDAIAAVPNFDFGGGFANLPLTNYTETQYENYLNGTDQTIPLSDFVYVNSATSWTIINYAAWQTAFEGDPNAATDDLPAATPQHDNVTNLVKYFCGVTANAAMSASDRAKLPAGGLSTDKKHLTLTYHQRPNLAVIGVTGAVQTSTDLQTWSTPTNATTTQTGTDPAGNAIMVVQVPVPASGPEFIRLSVTQQ